ncbi:MAG: DUF1461 domain-containing protein [Moraxellaceae bacterium]
MSHTSVKSLSSCIKTGVMPLLLLYVLVCLPLALTVYTPYAYQLYCPINPRCELLSASFAQQSMQQLTDFLQHQTPRLFPPWSHKENLHMLEVRGMYDLAAGLFVLALLWIGYDLWRPDSARRYQQYVQHSLKLSLGLLLACLFIMPFFQYFWMHIFHPLLFNNELWRTDRADISWYLMPREFFMGVIGFIVVSSLLLHLLLLAGLRGLQRTRSS